jgi:hypothetical protein
MIKYYLSYGSIVYPTVLLLIFLFFPNVIFSDLPILANDDLVNSIKTEAPLAWKEYLHLVSSYQGEAITKTTYQGSESTFKYDFWADYPNFLGNGGTEGNVEKFTGFNKKYTFRIKRNQGENWSVDYIEQLNDLSPSLDWSFAANSGNDNRAAKETGQKIASATAQGLLLNLDWLPFIFEENGMQIKKADRIVIDGENSVRITFIYEPSINNKNTLIRRGEIFLLPDRYWLIKKAALMGKESSASETLLPAEVSNVYEDVEGIPLLVKQQIKIEGSNGKKCTIETLRNNLKKTSVPFSYFTLSHYGLPEPDFDNSRHINRVRYILMGLGTIMILIALWRIIQKRRERK